MCWRPRRACSRAGRDLARDAVGARVLRLLLFRVDGEVLSLDLGLAAPSRDARHIARLIGLRLRSPRRVSLEADFGFEAAAMHVLVAERLAERQDRLGMAEDSRPPEEPRPADRPAAAAAGRGAVRSCIRARAISPSAPCAHALPPLPASVREGEVGAERCALQAAERGERMPPVPCSCCRTPKRPRSWQSFPKARPGSSAGAACCIRWPRRKAPSASRPEWWRRTAEEDARLLRRGGPRGRRFWLYRAGLYGRRRRPHPAMVRPRGVRMSASAGSAIRFQGGA